MAKQKKKFEEALRHTIQVIGELVVAGGVAYVTGYPYLVYVLTPILELAVDLLKKQK